MIRVVLQSMDQGSLLIDNESKYVRCGRGVLMYVAFLDASHAKTNDATTEHGDHASILDDERLQKAVNTLLRTKIFTHFSPEQMSNQAQSLEEVPRMDLLVVPQASLAGKINKKGNTVQFHSLIKNKETCESLYYRFVHLLRVARNVNEEEIDINGLPLHESHFVEMDDDGNINPNRNHHRDWLKYNGRVVCGTFGNRQGLRFASEGPFTHSFDL
ncbi:ubiquitin-like protein 5 [Strigomonas culicis]|uniref:Ubiquitin-like protein 5 n=1 Tax=Strigomonas culicis TaxID=28005 RepID=S9WCQ4_9TRYP|nr:ubiquitin-like protein 5 [Strigomonas culicis]EPY33855.1 ubiquitin-like protein 5 [Strigomonas culicis]EPY35926.1 ubiquitin-like protein 5 [Strigomonas culicis]|eukprot:EPY33790.1 ubiquitin-like protein 5 [Strigomonas culicis]